jgi:hypothetical protein
MLKPLALTQVAGLTNLATPFPQGLPGIFGGYFAGQQQDIARQNAGINQQAALQDMLFAQQKQPHEVEGLNLRNQTTSAQLPGIQATSNKLQRDNQVREGIPLDVEQKASLSKLYSEMSANDLKQWDDALSMALQDPSAAVRKQAEQIRTWTKQFRDDKDKSDRAIALEGLKATNAQAIMDQQIAAGRFKPKSGGGIGGAAGIDAAAASGKLNFEKASVAYQVLADQEDDPTLKAQYLQRAQQYEIAHQKSKQAGAQAKPTPDLEGLGVPSTGGAIPGPTLGAGSNAPAQTQYTTGQVYKGSTGSYRYKGGDPKNKVNWEKVQ